jgi:hypothetical protein
MAVSEIHTVHATSIRRLNLAQISCDLNPLIYRVRNNAKSKLRELIGGTKTH